MTKQDIAAASNAASVLRTFRESVKALCAVLPAGAGDKEAAVVRVLLDRVDQAIEVLAPSIPKLEPLSLLDVPVKAIMDPSTPQRRGSDRTRSQAQALASVGKDAELQGKCPVIAALQAALDKSAIAVAPATAPSAVTTDELRARMLKLADYAVHDYAPAYLSTHGLSKFQKELSDIPPLSNRETLPAAQLMLAKAARTAESCCFDQAEARSNTRASRLFQMLRVLVEELDGYVPKVGSVMARFAQVVHLDSNLVDREVLEHAFDTP